MVGAHVATGVAVRVTVEALTVPDHVKFHVRHCRYSATESVVEEPEPTLWGGGSVTVGGTNTSRTNHQRSAV